MASSQTTQQTFPLPKDPLTDTTAKLNKLRIRSQQLLSNSEEKIPIPTSQSPISPSSTAIYRHGPHGAMRWSKVNIHYVDDDTQDFIPLKSHELLSVNEKIYIHGDVEDEMNMLIRFDCVSMCWNVVKQNGEIPPATRAHSLTFIGNNTAIMFGGGKEQNYYSDLYSLDMNTWTWKKIQVPGKGPKGRRAHASCYDKTRNRIYIFGGGNGASALNDLWALDLKDGNYRWEELKSSSPLPMPRGYPSMNMIDDKLIVYGGSNGTHYFGDLYCYDIVNQRWIKTLQAPDKPRMGHATLIIGNYLFIIGGFNGTTYSNEIIAINLLSYQFETKQIGGIPFSERAYHACALFDSRIFLFCGFDGSTVFSDVWILDLASQSFLQRIPNFKVGIAYKEPRE